MLVRAGARHAPTELPTPDADSQGDLPNSAGMWHAARRDSGTWRARLSLRIASALLLVPIAGLSACSGAPSPLHPASQNADELRWFWWLLIAIAGLIFVAVVALLVWGALRQPSEEERLREHPLGGRLVWIGGIAIPIAVLALVFGISIALMIRQTAAASQMTIEVTGHQWWWEVRYPNEGIVTANEIHIPVGQTVRFAVTSADVIHAFWVPELGGKIDAIPGLTNRLQLAADHEGSFRGECATYCALQHANMNFVVVADAPSQYQAWVAGQKAAAATPSDAAALRGRQVFLDSACVYCHTVDGTSATGQAGPNLTHLASRQQIGAGVLPNTPGALGGWIVDPQASKPGNNMPPENFSGQDLQALLAYLTALK
jgi:cytochrome c oxidase subunit II